MKKLIYAILLVFVLGLVTACGEKTTPTPTTEPTPTEAVSSTPTEAPTETPSPEPTATEAPTATPTPEPTETPTPTLSPIEQGLDKSRFTGLWIPAEYVNARPYACMINNIHYAYPQSSLSKASIVYEVLVEFGITRFMAVYEAQNAQDALATRVGSIRSARKPMVEISRDIDAIYVHFGGKQDALDLISSSGLDSINAMGGIGSNCFYRDETLQSPHNAFLNMTQLASRLQNSGSYRLKVKEAAKNPFIFNDSDKELESDKEAKKITLNYSTYAIPYFVYNEDTGMYNRFAFGSLHTDASTGQALEFKNLIVMFVKQTSDAESNQTVTLEKSAGSGYYITNGKCIPIIWDRNLGYTRYFDSAGNLISLNPGTTYVSLFPNYNTKGVVIE